MLIDRASLSNSDSPAFVVNRVAMQKDYMDEIWKSFPDVRLVLPLWETEVRGTAMLKRVVQALFA